MNTPRKHHVILQCTLCNYSCRFKSNLARHMVRHLNSGSCSTQKPYKCSECDFASDKSGKLDTHIKSKHKVTNKDGKGMKLRNVCSKNALDVKNRSKSKDRKKIFKKEIPKNDKNIAPFNCKQCNYSSSTRRFYLRHLVTRKHGPYHQFSKLDFKPHKCQHCSFASDGTKKLHLHIRRYHEGPDISHSISGLATVQKVVKKPTESELKETLKSHKYTEDSFLSDKEEIHERHVKKKLILDQKTEAINKEQISGLKTMSINGKTVSIFQCPQCNYFTSAKNSFLRHTVLKNHGSYSTNDVKFDPKPFKCSDCSFATDGKKKLHIHINHKHSIKTGKDITGHGNEHNSSNVPNIDFRNAPDQKKERKLKELSGCDDKFKQTPILYKCCNCSFVSKWKGHLDRHVLRKHSSKQKGVTTSKDQTTGLKKAPKGSQQVTVFQCTQCEYKTSYRKHFMRHVILRKHGSYKNWTWDPNPHKCPYCSYGSDRRQYLDRHINSKHTSVLNKDSKEATIGKGKRKLESCNDTSYSLRSASKSYECIVVHDHDVNMHVNTKKIKVIDCNDTNAIQAGDGKAKETADRLKLAKKPFKCPICSYTSKWKGHLNRHVSRQHSSKAKGVTASKDQITGLKKVPKGSKQVTVFQCTQCEYKTSYRNNFMRHVILRKHGSYKSWTWDPNPHKCPRCSYASDRRKSLDRHMNSKHNPLKDKHLKDATIQRGDYSLRSARKSFECIDLTVHDRVVDTPINIVDTPINDEQNKVMDSKDTSATQTVEGRSKETADILEMTKKPYKCSECTFASDRKANLDAHVRCKHVSQPASRTTDKYQKTILSGGPCDSEEKKLWCAVCDAELQDDKDMDKHNSIVHTFSIPA